jgi:GT2 family glycosyltransferase/MoaA/NifB/PqqE/SkfB family radical SAM enzyme
VERNYPKVSIVTVNFNGKKHLKKFFDSVSKLNYPKNKLKVILVDNASTDNSVEAVRKDYPKVKIIRNDVNNYCKANNLGIKASETEFVALVNNDTRMDKDWLVELVKVISEDKKIACVGGEILTMEGKIQNAGHYELPNFYWGERGAGQERKKYDSVEEVASLCGAAILCRKNALLEAGLFDEDFIIYGEDVDMSLRLRQKKYKLVFVPASIIYHQFHGTADNEFSRYYIERNRLLYLAKHYPHKLSDSLIGNGNFTIKKSIESLGKLYLLIPEVILKLIKTHPLETVKDVLQGLFKEIGRISNLENDILVDKFNAMADDQKKINVEINLKRAIFNRQRMDLEEKIKVILDKEQKITNKSVEIKVLQGEIVKLRKREKAVLVDKEQTIKDKSTQIKVFSEEIRKLQVKEKASVDMYKAIADKEQEITNKSVEIKVLQEEIEKLRKREKTVLVDKEQMIKDQDVQIKILQEGIQALQEKEKVMKIIADKDNQINEKNKKLRDKETFVYKEEIKNLSEKLRIRIEEVFSRDQQLIDKKNEIDFLKNELSVLAEQLADNLVKIEENKNLFQDKENDILAYKEELINLSKQLRQRMDEVLIKDGQLIEAGVQISALDAELFNLSKQLRERIDEVLIKDGQLIEAGVQISALDAEPTNLSKQLRQRMDEVLIKDGQLIEAGVQISALDAEPTNLSKQLRERIDEIVKKDSQLTDKDNRISLLDAELLNLSAQLRKRMDEVLMKNSQLCERIDEIAKKDIQLADKENKISSLDTELNGIYNSDGFRFVLRPLWTVIGNMRGLIMAIFRKFTQVFWFAIAVTLTPVFLCLGLCFLMENSFGFIFGPLLKRIAPERKVKPIKDSKISLVIPNYNGVSYLKECLPSVFSADGFSDGQNEVLVIDDGSKDGSVDFIRENFPRVRLIKNRKNRGFGFTCNRGVKAAKNEIIVLINNDIILTKDFLDPLLSHLQRNEEIFTVTPKLYGWDRQTFVWGMHMGHYENGYIRLWNESEIGSGDKISEAAPTIFAIGGAMVFRKGDFLWLGGFDAIYRPNCWEDIDISYRAWKRGLKVIYEPSSLMYHKGRATLTYERPKEIKNELLFTWKNITDHQILKEHLNLLPWNLYRNRGAFLKGFFWALNHLPQTLLHRFLERGYILDFEDKKIFNKIMLYYGNFIKRGLSHPSGEKPNVLIVSRFLPYPLNMGGKIRIHNLVKSLSNRYNFSLLSLIDHKDELKYLPKLKEIFSDVYPVYAKSPLGLDFSWQRFYPEQYKLGYSYSQGLVDKLKELKETKPLDMIHIESNELLYLVDYAGCLPIVYTEHDISFLSLGKSYYKKDSQFFWPLIDNLKRIYFHNTQFKKIDRVVTLSREDENVLRGFFPKTDITLVPTGVDLKHFSLENNVRKTKKLIFVGHYRHYPNEDAVVYFVKKIFPLIRKEMPDVELLMVGSNPTVSVENLTQEENVVLVGEVQDVKPYLEDAWVFVNSIRVSAGIKGKVLEAMASGVPVVSTTVGSSGIDACPGEEILIADNPKEFASQVIRLLKDEEFRANLIMNARQLVEHKYGWFKSMAKLDSVYKSLLFDTGYDNPNFYLTDKIVDKANNLVDRKIEQLGDDIAHPESGPEELHIELTYNCNSKCIMCDLWDYNKRTPKASHELSLDEIKSFVGESRLLQKPKVVVLSGGEPFLRNDIVDLCGFFSKQLPHSSIGILTNGINTEVILNKTKDVLNRFQPQSLWLGSSLDGIGKEHDKIRGIEGAFAGLCKTINHCKKELPKVKFSVTFTLTPYNVDQLIPAKQFADSEGLDFFAQFVVPKQAREEFIWTPQDLDRANKEIMQINQGIIAKISQGGSIDSLDKIKDKYLISQLYYWSHLVKYQVNPQRFFKKCVAGSKFAMFNPYGDCYFCPGHKSTSIGNIRDQRFDNLWNSERAQNMRSFIKDGDCHCWLVCTVFPALEKALNK